MPTLAPTKGRLISHFENRETPDHGKAWSDLWDSGESDLWDRGLPSPALIDLIEEYDERLFHPFQSADSGERKRVLVPGCGRGYDVISLSLHGFDAYGLEISSTAVAEARELAAKEMTSPSPNNFGIDSSTDPQNLASGMPRFIEGDFFDSTWSDALGFQFDVIYDYTVCPSAHPKPGSPGHGEMAMVLSR
ncbi:S-adenosyl-L-methionine-dependent methyltransferase [Aspergillus granulosus]|uniref:S-adenosyl-L-methionine-dependent methyltransferase n=1 Tax=Aspergillus granulosus TaxID=176169 RepID=A0ABR4GTV2_9EURO